MNKQNTNKKDVLFIAKNIPVPKKNSNRIIHSNRIIFDIAHHLSNFAEIKFLFPKELIPFWLRTNPKFTYLINLKHWLFEGFSVTPISYIKLPFRHIEYWTLCYLPRKLKTFIKKNGKPELVHAHYIFPDGYLAYKIFKLYNVPYVITFRNYDKQFLEQISPKNPDYRKAKRIISNASTIITPNLTYKDFVDQNFHTDCKIVPHGIDPSIFETTLTESKNETIRITTVAEAIKRKNIDWVIRACKEYKGNKDIKLNIVGKGPELESLKKLAANNRRILFHGHIPHQQVIQMFKENHIFALPSFNETFGMVYLEAAATHNALIGFKGEGVWRVFEENKEMLFCSTYNEFEQQLFNLIENKSKRIRITENAYTKAKTMKWSSVTKMYSKVYKRALEKY